MVEFNLPEDHVPVPNLPGIAPIVAVPKTYQEYYDDESKDKMQGNYASIMNAFTVAPVGPAVVTPQALADAVYNTATVDPQAFVLLIVNAAFPAGKIHLFHRLQKFSPHMGNPTEFDGKGYAFHGDVGNGQAPTCVEWPNTAFHLSTAVRVPTKPILDQLLAADAGLELVGPFGQDEEGTESIRTRNSMIVPFRYIRLFLAHPLTPKEAWVQVAGAIYGDNQQETCAPLVDWLRMALVRQGPEQASRLGQVLPTVPFATTELKQRRWELLVNDLPAMSGNATIAAGNVIAESLQELVVADNRTSRLADERRRTTESAKTPEKCFGDVGTMKLLRICQVGNSGELPKIWLDLAKTPKNQALVTIQQAFDQTTLDLKLGSGGKLPITPDLVTKIRSVSFEMSDEDDLSTGITPFTFAYMDDRELTLAYDKGAQFLLLQSGAGAASLIEVASLMKTDKVRIPLTLVEATITFQNFWVALNVLLGDKHALTEEFGVFWKAWSTSQRTLMNLKLDPTNQLLFPALAVRWIQIRFSIWIEEQAADNEDVSIPPFRELMKAIRQKENWTPPMPDQYVTKVTNDTVNEPESKRARGATDRRTTAINPAFKRFADMSVKVRDVIRKAGVANKVPDNENGVQMCVTYHIKGMCNNTCTRKEDHREHRAAEDEKLLQSCNRHYKS